MKLVIEHYGKFMLEGIVIIALAGIIFTGLTDVNGNQGIFYVTGAQLEIEKENYQDYTDFKDIYKTESDKDVPQIIWQAGRINTGMHTLANYVRVTDYAGNILGFNIKSIIAPDNTEVITSYNQDTTEINLSQAGIYTVTIFAQDEGNRTVKAKIKIPVNGNSF